MVELRDNGASSVLLVALAIVAVGLAGAGTLLAASEEALLRECTQLAMESPLDPAYLTDESAGAVAAVEVGTSAPRGRVVQPGVVLSGTGADLAVHRAVEFLMEKGLKCEGQRVIALLARGAVRVGARPPGWDGIAVPRSCGELTTEEERDPERGFARTVALARALLQGVNALAPETAHGDIAGPAPEPIAVWTRTLETMSSWVREATRAVESAGASGGSDEQAFRALVMVDAMRMALRDYADQGYCGDPRGEAWADLRDHLGKTRELLKKKMEPEL
jgi:hypothetical protein